MRPSSTIRLFVSSTFTDMKAERDLLQRKVFKRLREKCQELGLRFQAIDLRWGVSEEAGRDNRTMRICLRELKRCQSGGPKPNFLILLGDRYGWCPLPEIIPAALFEKLEIEVNAENEKTAELLRPLTPHAATAKNSSPAPLARAPTRYFRRIGRAIFGLAASYGTPLFLSANNAEKTGATRPDP
jgi:hypothetical protein